MNINEALIEVREEVLWATKNHKRFNSPHEGYAVIKEELDELWSAIRTLKNFDDRNEQIKLEAIQVAAMAVRFLMDLVEP